MNLYNLHPYLIGSAMKEYVIPELAYATVKTIGRDPGLERVVAKSPEYSYYYACDVIKRRFPEGEAAIVERPRLAYYYARYVIQGRFPEGEASIAMEPEYAYKYACDVIKRRFPKGEAAIKASSYWNEYKKKFK